MTLRVLADPVVLSVALARTIPRYCCNVGAFHVKRAMDPSVHVAEDESIQQWVTGSDLVLVRAVATAVGADRLALLAAHFSKSGAWLNAAKVERAVSTLTDEAFGDATHSKAALALVSGLLRH